MNPAYAPPPGLMADATFRAGFAVLAPLNLSFDAWLYHPQIGDVTALAQAFPDTRICLNHVGGPLGIGGYAGQRDAVFAAWSRAIRALAHCPNVVVKLGGMAMRINGFDFHEQADPPSSEALAAAWKPYVETCIEAFGATRCMFESNFPVDKGSYAYAPFWNACWRAAPVRRRRLRCSAAPRRGSTGWKCRTGPKTLPPPLVGLGREADQGQGEGSCVQTRP